MYFLAYLVFFGVFGVLLCVHAFCLVYLVFGSVYLAYRVSQKKPSFSKYGYYTISCNFSNGANSGSSGPREEVKKGKSSEFNPQNDGQVKFSLAPKVWSHKSFNPHPKNCKKF